MTIYEVGGIRPKISDGEGCWIAPNAQIIGNIKIADEVNIWFGAVLRGDIEAISIAARTNIQDQVVCHTDVGYPLTVGKNCTIGHNAAIHGCTIGDNTLIGMAAVVLTGATIGRCCIIGANSLVPEGMTIPDFSLAVGSPVIVKRILDKSIEDQLLAAAAKYTARARLFAKTLTPITD